MKKFLVGMSLLLASTSMAGELESIVCTQDNLTLGISTAKIGGRGKGSMEIPVMVLQKDNQVVGSKNLNLDFAGYEDSLLNAYMWAFSSTDQSSVVGVAVPDLQQLIPGTYKASADIFAEIDGVVLSGSTVPCQVSIK